MDTLHPVVILGSYFWNQELLPRDEFGERLRAVRALMKENGWDGLAVYGDCAEPGLLAWLTNVSPRMRWTLALIPQAGEPMLVVPGAVRDFPITALMTPISDIRTWGAVSQIVPQWAGALRPGHRPAVAVYGAQRMAPSNHAAAIAPLMANAEIVDVASEFEPLMRKPRSRETWLLKEGSRLSSEAALTFRSLVLGGARPAAAALEAEKAARLKAAHDVRILLSRDRGRSLEPFVGMDVPAEDPSTAYIAIRYLGYWTEAIVTASTSRGRVQEAVEAALNSMIESAQVGQARKDVAAFVGKHLKGLDRHPVLGASAVLRMGLSLDESQLWQTSDEDRLESGAVYSLRAAACGPEAYAASALVKLGAKNEVLWSSAAEA